jgi:cation diffusion facilitator family transporter
MPDVTGGQMAKRESKTAVYAALAGNAAVAATKFAAAWWTGSAAMLSEAIHSLVDTGNQLLLLYGMRQAAREATPEHPFGFGLELYFWTFVVAILIFGLGAGVSIWEGIDKIRNPGLVEHATVNFVVLGMSLLFEGSTWWVAFRAFRRVARSDGLLAAVLRSKDPTVFTVLLEDSAAVSGLFVAMLSLALAQALDLPVLDGVASVLIGLLLAGTAAFLARESKGLLIGEALRPAAQRRLRALAGEAPGVTGVNEVLTMHFGPADVLAVLSLDFDDGLTAAEVEGTVSMLEQTIKHTFPEIRRIFVEAQSREGHDLARQDSRPFTSSEDAV